MQRTSYIEGSFNPNDVSKLLAGSLVPFAETHTEYAALPLTPSTGPFPDPDCSDLDPINGVVAGSSRCGSSGLVFNRHTDAWEGIAGPPSLNNTLAASSTDEVDEFGRPNALTTYGDLRRTDDDVCTQLEYASSPNGGPFPSVPSTMTITDCGWGQPFHGRPGTPMVLSRVRFLYDEQPHGTVVRGRLTSREVDRFGPSGYIDTHTVDRTTYNILGEIATTTTERAQGTSTSHVIELQYDAFGATVTSTTERASDVAQAFTSTTTVSSWPSIPSNGVDHTGVATSVTFDRFGRKVLSVVDTGTRKSVLSRSIYDDSRSGRHVTVETFPGDTQPGQEATTTDKQVSSAELDALGRVRFSVHELGSDYGARRVIADLTKYDSLGRVAFVAAPFETSENPFVPDPLAEPFGTSVAYDRRGRVVREVSAQGPLPYATETSVPDNIFVRSYRYYYENGEALTGGSGADDNDPHSDSYLALDVTYQSALGRETRRARHAPGGERIDLVEQDWDRLGRIVHLRRYLQPSIPTAAITWTSEFDSLGRRLSYSEPGTSTKNYTFDEDGNEISSTWQDGSRQRLSRAVYDGFGRVVSRQLSTITNGVEEIESSDRFHYDAHSGRSEQPQSDLRGRLSWAETTGVGAVFYGYDSLGRASSTSYLYDGHNQLVREATTQAPGGRLQQLTLTTSVGTDVIDYGYDSAERLRHVYRGGAPLIDARDVDAKGRYRSVAYANGTIENFDYAPYGREELVGWSAPGHAYEYLELDGAGRLRFERDNTPSGYTSFAYEHDALGRLTAMAKSTGGVPGVETYTHDPLGNMLTRTATTGIQDLVYQRDPVDPDRMCRIAEPGSSGPCQFDYDGAGNVVVDRSGKANRRLTYDAGQRITHIYRGVNEVSLVHGPAGRAHTEVRTGTGRREAWHFGLVEERRSGDVSVIERRIPGPLGVTVSLRTERMGTRVPKHAVIYAHGDGRANRVFTDDTGAIVQSASYGTYGKTTTTAIGPSMTQTDDLWNGGDNLPEVGVVLLGPRAYDPDQGRFLQRDPLAVVLRASSANPYAFAFSNPVDFADPSGLQGEHSGGGGGTSGPGAVIGSVTTTAIGILIGTDSRSPLHPQNAVGADGYTGTSIEHRARSLSPKCRGLCAAGRTAYAAGDVAYSTYGSYLAGKAEALWETAVEVGEAAEHNAKCTAQGVYCVYKRIRGAPDTVRHLGRTLRSIPDAGKDALEHPIETMCDADGCSAREVGRIEEKTKIAIASGAVGGEKVIDDAVPVVDEFIERTIEQAKKLVPVHRVESGSPCGTRGIDLGIAA